MAETIQASTRTKQAGNAIELSTGGAICKAGGRVYGRRQHQDVCCEEQFIAWGVANAWLGIMFLHGSIAELVLAQFSMGMALEW